MKTAKIELPLKILQACEDNYYVGDQNGEIVCVVSDYIMRGRDVKPRAEFIVRACNSHDKLLEACKAFLAATLDARTDKRGCTCSRCLDAQGELEAAIVLAEKENG